MQPFYPILPNEKPPPGGKEEVGNKAWNLMRMVAAGLSVPAGFVLPTDWCRLHRRGTLDETLLREALSGGIKRLEAASGLGFGIARRPLLVSVRSGAAVSMPGMMETVLDIGLNPQTVDGLIRQTGNPRLAWDSFRRLVQGYAEVVAGLPAVPFDALVADALAAIDAASERELDHLSLRRLTQAMLEEYQAQAGSPFPADPAVQLMEAARAVLGSWDAPKAASYRKLNGIDDDAGTAVTVQAMVYGNAGGASGAGVGFTRNPATGEREFYFDFQFNGQGEDVVAGRQVLRDNARLRRILPNIWTELEKTCHELELLFRDAQDFEFTIEAGRLYLLQARRAKRTPWAAIRIAVAMAEEGLIGPDEALAQLHEVDIAAVGRTRFAPPLPEPLARADIAGIGVASGAIALDSDAAGRMAASGASVILVRRETSTADIEGMAAAAGILTATGGRTSHAAVVARQLGKVCLVGCPDLTTDMDRRVCRIGGRELPEGSFLSVDGNDGAIYAGQLTAITERPQQELAVIKGWQAAVGPTTRKARAWRRPSDKASR
jgi:pyruvate,orthophosphate dikinase